jgi:OOP family OmpA-OmpF porin
MSLKSALQRVSLLLVLVIPAVAAAPAAAQDRPFHVEANVGRASVDNIDGIRLNESTTTYRLGTGYNFFDWLGVDGAFVDLGTIESTVDIGSGQPLPVEAAASGFEVTLTGHVPLTEAFALIAHAGVLWWTGDTSLGSAASSDSGNDPTWGVGVEYAFGPTFAVTASWRRYKIDSVDADAAWLGMMVRFGDAP